jgi:hypothetical protein
MSANPEDVIVEAIQTYQGKDPDYDDRVDARATIAALHAAGFVIEQDWQPIETAPTDGTAVLCWPFNYSSLFEGKAEPEIVIGFFSEDDWWCESTVAKTFDPTHWRPLPTPPQ